MCEKFMHNCNSGYATTCFGNRNSRSLIRQATTLKPQQRRHRLQIVLDTMMDLANCCIFAQKSLITTTNVGHITHQN